MNNQELKEKIKIIKNHFKKYDEKIEENEEYSNFSKWCAGITDKPKEKKKELERIANVEYFEKWDLGTLQNAIDIRNILINDLGFRPFVMEKSILPSIVKYSELKFSFDEKLKDDFKYVFIFRNQ
jgi:hypothetical protein